MKTKLFYIFAVIIYIPFVALREGGRQATGDIATKGFVFDTPVRASPYLPQIDLDFSDLDVRDDQNHPINDTGLIRQLSGLFSGNLFNLAIQAEQHGMDQIWRDVESISHLLNSLFLSVVYPLERAAQAALRPSEKRVVHNVDNLCKTFSVGNFLTLFVFTFYLTKRPFRYAVLRC